MDRDDANHWKYRHYDLYIFLEALKMIPAILLFDVLIGLALMVLGVAVITLIIVGVPILLLFLIEWTLEYPIQRVRTYRKTDLGWTWP